MSGIKDIRGHLRDVGGIGVILKTVCVIRGDIGGDVRRPGGKGGLSFVFGKSVISGMGGRMRGMGGIGFIFGISVVFVVK